MSKQRPIVILSVLLMAAGSLPAAIAQEENWLPAPTGPYPVGTTLYHWVDETRDETLTDDPDDKRELMVQIWYPAEVEADAILATYFPQGEADVQGFKHYHTVDPVTGTYPAEEIAQTPTHSNLDAPVSNEQPDYPVLINTMFPIFATSRIEEFASHGYVVASIYPTHLWGWTVFPDGREVIGMFRDDFFADEALETYLEIAAQDQMFVLDQLTLLNESSATERFSGRLQLDRVGSFGRSWGAWVTMMSGMRDSRFKAVLCIVPHAFVPQVVYYEGLEQPVMFMDAEGEPSGDALLGIPGDEPAYKVTLNNITSFSIGDFALWPGAPSDKPGRVEPTRAIHVVNAYAVAFFDRHLMGQEAPLLDGPSSDYREVDLQIREITD